MKFHCILTVLFPLSLAACQMHHFVCGTGTPLITPKHYWSYPESKTVDQVYSYHGIKISDPYRWLEDIDSPDTKAWIEAQNKFTSEYLAPLQEREAIKQRLTEIWNYEKMSVPKHYGSRYFFSKNDGLQNQAVLYVSESLHSAPRLLLDPNTLSSDGTIALKDYAVSKNGKYMAYGLSSGGSDWEEWYVLDVDTGKKMDDELHWVKFTEVSWQHDGSGFYYSRYDEPKDDNALKAINKFQKLYFHKLGTKQTDDLLVYERKDQPEWGFSPHVSEDGRYLVITARHGTLAKNLILVQDLTKKKAPIDTIFGEWDADYQFIGNQQDTLYFLTDNHAPRYRILAYYARKNAKPQQEQIIPETESTIRNAYLFGGNFIVEYLKDAHSEIKRYDLLGKLRNNLNLPGLGSIHHPTHSGEGFSGSETSTEMFYSYTSYTTPTSIYRVDLNTGTNELLFSPKVAFDPAQFETRQVFANSKDGTRIPLFITARNGLDQNGNNPTILYGYGGFNVSQTPSFSPAIMGWLDHGGVYVVANLRGGGEFGREWHEAGTKTHKQNVFDDFIAAAEYLISENYTKPEKLAISGRSNGGLLVAATELQRPDLFAAAIPSVGVLDMLRFRDFTIGQAWESDYGSVLNEDEFKALLAYSPLHNIKPGIIYPSTLILTGDHDDRVFPAHSFKFTAAMQRANATGNPALIRIETRAGHGQGKPTAKQIEETADVYAFTLKAFNDRRDIIPAE